MAHLADLVLLRVWEKKRYECIIHWAFHSTIANTLTQRKATLLPEIQKRNKTGGIIDRRIGESDPNMTPEERALQRFAREKQRRKGGALFDLEEAEDEGAALTHLGRSLDLDSSGPPIKDDFDEEVSDISGDEEDRPLKRRRASEGEDDEEQEFDEEAEADGPARKKTKAEVMKEVMAKSKLHKYERQKAKDDDDDLREELDKGMSEMLALLNGHRPPPKSQNPESSGQPGMNPDRLAMLEGTARQDADREYDQRLRQLAMDKRATPTERTKTDEEAAIEDAQRLKELESSRLRRMQGEVDEDEEEPKPKREKAAAAAVKTNATATADDEEMDDDAAEFGLAFTQSKAAAEPLVLDDEDEFVLEDDLVASASDADMSDSSGESESGDSDDEAEPLQQEDEEEDEFVRGILGKSDRTGANTQPLSMPVLEVTTPSLAYTYACPSNHDEFLEIINSKGIAVEEIPTVVQRIRALYHPSLSAENKKKLSEFAGVLVDHVSYMAKQKQPLAVIETLIRHIHSLSRTYPVTIATAFRNHLLAFHKHGSPTAGDLVILTAIGSIYPTSDHFHQVVTPAITLMARWLEMTSPNSALIMTTGAFIVLLCVKYQKLSKRYIPEAVRFTIKALQSRPQSESALLQPHVDNLLAMADLWREKSSFREIFAPAALSSLQNLKGHKKAVQHLSILLQQAKLRRRPLELHHHRPLGIRTSVPKFEESFNPDKHYDPDRERAEASKLRAEFKREKKGAVRELRKDANFISREQLREKKERDAEYEKKYRRLVAEIQGEEGHESKVYEREKRMRKGGR